MIRIRTVRRLARGVSKAADAYARLTEVRDLTPPRKKPSGKTVACLTGAAVGGLAAASAAAYTEIVTTVVARRRSPLLETVADCADSRMQEKARRQAEAAEAKAAENAVPTEEPAFAPAAPIEWQYPAGEVSTDLGGFEEDVERARALLKAVHLRDVAKDFPSGQTCLGDIQPEATRPPDPASARQRELDAEAFRVHVGPLTETVAIRSQDGFVLRAHYYPCENPKRVVLLAHGWHSAWYRDFCYLAPFLHEHDCDLLLIDQRCHGESGGALIAYGIRERYDILDWIDWLEKNHPACPIYLGGQSMGAATVLMAAGLPIQNRVCGIIADCGYTAPEEIVSMGVRRTVGGFTGPTMTALNLNLRVRDKFRLTDYTTLEAMKANETVPILFIHGTADDFVPYRMTLENYLACAAPKELLLVPGAGHCRSHITSPDAYEQKVLHFFAAWDPPAPPKKRGFFHFRTSAMRKKGETA